MRKTTIDGMVFVSFSKGGDSFLRDLAAAAAKPNRPVKKPRPAKKS